MTDSQLHMVQLASDQEVDQAIEAAKSEPMVEYAEPNYVLRVLGAPSTLAAPNDPEFSKLWGIQNTGQADAQGQIGKSGADINVMPLWDAGHRGDKKIVVAIIDTGIEWSHPDLADNLFVNSGESGTDANGKDMATNGVDDDSNGFVDDVHGFNFAADTGNSRDDNNHGTHCAGTIGGVGNNGKGVVGVNWQVSLMPVKFLTADGGGTLQDAVESIQYATKMRVNVMSNSWGGGGFSQAMFDAIKQARDAGILFVAAAGNSSSDNDGAPSYPASYQVENVLSVAASDNLDAAADFTNWGAKSVHVAAPGVQIMSTVRGGKYAAYSGTSMATPHVSGIAALIYSAQSGTTFADLKERLIKTSTPVKGLRRKVVAAGRVSAYNAFNNIVPPSNEPDPALWVPVAKVIESAHPYAKNLNQTFEIDVPNAKFIRVHFEKVETEANYDKVILESASGEVVETLSGNHADVTSDYIEGGKAVIRLKSDYDVQGWGFKIDRIDVIMN